MACTEFSDLFDAEFADADKCLTLVDIGDECGEFDLVTAVACADGSGHKLGVVPGGASCFGVVTNTGHWLVPC